MVAEWKQKFQKSVKKSERDTEARVIMYWDDDYGPPVL